MPHTPTTMQKATLDQLYQQPERFGFFQAVRLLLLAQGQLPLHDRASLQQAVQRTMRLGAQASMAFPASEIQSLYAPGNAPSPATLAQAEPPLLRVNFFGLYGPSGTLPTHYTEWLMRQRQPHTSGAAAFLDLFNHRALLLFWQAWARHAPAIMQELADAQGAIHHVHDLIGMGTPGLLRTHRASATSGVTNLAPTRHSRASADRALLPDAALGYYSGLIGQQPHGSTTVAQIIGDYCHVPASAHPCLGTWKAVPQRTRLGLQAARLGESALLGSCYWDRQSTLRLRLGPLTLAQFQRLLPDRPLLGQALTLARFLIGLAPDLRVQLRLTAAEVPALQLQTPAAHAEHPSPRLGWNTWLTGRRSAAPVDDCEFHFPATGAPSWR